MRTILIPSAKESDEIKEESNYLQPGSPQDYSPAAIPLTREVVGPQNAVGYINPSSAVSDDRGY